MRKNILFTLFVFALTISFCTNVSATEASTNNQATSTEVTTVDDALDDETREVPADTMGVMKLSVQYSTGIPLAPEDVFIVYYQTTDATYHGTLELTASELAGKLGVLDLKCGNYRITGCNYIGTSQDVITQGYAYTSEFTVTSNEASTDTFYLYIGEEMVEILKKTSPKVNVVKDNYDYGQAETSKQLEENGETLSYSPSVEQTIEKPPVESATTEQASTQETKTDTPKKKGSNFGKLIPFLLFAVIGMGTAYVLMLKGKL